MFTFGCYYRNSGSKFMSMYGSVTDAQVFSRELSDKEMVDMTTCKQDTYKNQFSLCTNIAFLLCRNFLNGDVIRWDREQWQLKSPFQTSEEVVLDLEKDICDSTENGGLFLVPQKFSFTESVHICKTLAGKMVTYMDKADFDDLIYYLSLSVNMKAGGCVEQNEDSSQIQIWAGGKDDRIEGSWETWNGREHIKV